jgi:hypothetical protein
MPPITLFSPSSSSLSSLSGGVGGITRALHARADHCEGNIGPRSRMGHRHHRNASRCVPTEVVVTDLIGMVSREVR